MKSLLSLSLVLALLGGCATPPQPAPVEVPPRGAADEIDRSLSAKG